MSESTPYKAVPPKTIPSKATPSKAILCDSFIWVEVFKGTKRADKIIKYLEGKGMVISAITLFEVYKKYLLSEPQIADEILDQTIVNSEKIVDPKRDLCIRAAELASKYKSLSMADSLILATAEAEGIPLFTGDEDFKKEQIEEAEIVHLDDI